MIFDPPAVKMDLSTFKEVFCKNKIFFEPRYTSSVGDFQKSQKIIQVGFYCIVRVLPQKMNSLIHVVFQMISKGFLSSYIQIFRESMLVGVRHSTSPARLTLVFTAIWISSGTAYREAGTRKQWYKVEWLLFYRLLINTALLTSIIYDRNGDTYIYIQLIMMKASVKKRKKRKKKKRPNL